MTSHYSIKFAGKMMEYPVPTTDEEYIDLRIKRNNQRDEDDKNLVYHGRNTKPFDNALEVYEREKGTDYCQKIWLTR